MKCLKEMGKCNSNYKPPWHHTFICVTKCGIDVWMSHIKSNRKSFSKFVGIVTNVCLDIVTKLIEHELVVSCEIGSYIWRLWQEICQKNLNKKLGKERIFISSRSI
jgi:hypothetical protein